MASLEPGEYESLVARAAGGNTGASIELLQAMRANKIHQPDLVLLHGSKLLVSCPGKLGQELWTVLEQVFLASVDLGSTEWRDYCIGKLKKKWPNSTRVERLTGILEESKENYGAAVIIYQKMLKEKPEDTITSKRQIALLKQQGKNSEAIGAINKYLEVFCTDIEAWHELAELYIEHGSLSRAVFCFEELMVSNPRSMYHILTYAELLYSTGDYELSRKYYSLASYLDNTCLRALWGLYAVNLALVEKDQSGSAEKMAQLQGFTKDHLKTQYKSLGKECSHGKIAMAMITNDA